MGKWSDKSVFIMAEVKPLWHVTLLEIMRSMEFAECLVTHVGLFVKGIIESLAFFYLFQNLKC